MRDSSLQAAAEAHPAVGVGRQLGEMTDRYWLACTYDNVRVPYPCIGIRLNCRSRVFGIEQMLSKYCTGGNVYIC
jgi:hypothetical protein